MTYRLTDRAEVEAYKATAFDKTAQTAGHSTARRVKDILKGRGCKGDDVLREVRRFVGDRILARICAHPDAERFMVKGGSLWFLDDAASARPTLDLDIHIFEDDASHDEMIDILHEALATDIGDGMFFDIQDAHALEHTAQDRNGLRVFIEGWAGTMHVISHIDFGFGGTRPETAVKRTFKPLVKGSPAAELYVQPWEYVVSDKLSAVLQHGAVNTRMKDYRDLWHLSRRDWDDDRLGRAFGLTSAKRGWDLDDEGVPEGFDVSFAMDNQVAWERYLDNNGLRDTVPTDFLEVMCDIRPFFGRVRELARPTAKLEAVIAARNVPAYRPGLSA